MARFKKGHIPHNKGRGIYKNCLVCDKQLYVPNCLKDRKKLCSRKCLYKSNVYTNGFQKGHKDLVPASSRGHTEATKKKIGEVQRAKHRVPIDYRRKRRNLSSWQYKEWRSKVFKRDNYTCQICQQYGGALHADHIERWIDNKLLRYSVDNGRTLCVPCHYYVTFKRKMPIGVNWCNYTHRKRG